MLKETKQRANVPGNVTETLVVVFEMRSNYGDETHELLAILDAKERSHRIGLDDTQQLSSFRFVCVLMFTFALILALACHNANQIDPFLKTIVGFDVIFEHSERIKREKRECECEF